MYFRRVWNLHSTMRRHEVTEQRGTLEKPEMIRSSFALAECYAAVKSALELSRKGPSRWATLINHPGEFIHAELRFQERIGGSNEIVLNRQILMSVYFTERADGTDIKIDYEIHSPMNQSTCKGIVQRMTNQLNLGLT